MTKLEEYDCLLNLVKKRRSVRQFRPDPIPEGYVEKIIEVARWAPSGFHTQPWEFVVARKKEIREAIIAALDRRAPPITKTDIPRRSFRDAPVFIIALIDWRAMTGLPNHPTEKSERVVNIYCSSLANAFLYLHLAASSLGLSSQWYSGASNPAVEQEIKDIIGIPEPLTIYDMVVLGYPDIPPDPKDVRPLTGMIHYDNCGSQDFRSDEQVASDAEKTWAWCMAAH